MVRISVGTTRVIQLTIKIHFPKIDLVSCYAHLIVLAFAILSLALALRLQGRLQIFSSLVAILLNQQKLLLLFSKRTFFCGCKVSPGCASLSSRQKNLPSLWKSRGCQSWPRSLLWLRIWTDSETQWNLHSNFQLGSGWRSGSSQGGKISPQQWKKAWWRLYPVWRWWDAWPGARYFYCGEFKIKYARAVCGETWVSGRVRIPEEDQKHGKSAARSQLPVCSNCGKLLWSMASCCNNPDQEANKSKVHKVELGRG